MIIMIDNKKVPSKVAYFQAVEGEIPAAINKLKHQSETIHKRKIRSNMQSSSTLKKLTKTI